MALLGELTGKALAEALQPLLTDLSLRVRVAERARAHGRLDAAERLVDVVLSAAASG